MYHFSLAFSLSLSPVFFFFIRHLIILHFIISCMGLLRLANLRRKKRSDASELGWPVTNQVTHTTTSTCYATVTLRAFSPFRQTIRVYIYNSHTKYTYTYILYKEISKYFFSPPKTFIYFMLQLRIIARLEFSIGFNFISLLHFYHFFFQIFLSVVYSIFFFFLVRQTTSLTLFRVFGKMACEFVATTMNQTNMSNIR